MGCLLGEKLDHAEAGRDGHHAGRSHPRTGRWEAAFKAFLGASEDLIKNIHSVAPVAELDGDEIGFLVGKVAEIKRQR